VKAADTAPSVIVLGLGPDDNRRLDAARERVAAIAASNGAAQAVAVLLDSIDRRLAELRAADQPAVGAPTLADRVAALEARLAALHAEVADMRLSQQPTPRRKR